MCPELKQFLSLTQQKIDLPDNIRTHAKKCQKCLYEIARFLASYEALSSINQIRKDKNCIMRDDLLNLMFSKNDPKTPSSFFDATIIQNHINTCPYCDEYIGLISQFVEEKIEENKLKIIKNYPLVLFFGNNACSINVSEKNYVEGDDTKIQ